MKKIMKEWKSWLVETAPTEKDFAPPPKPEGASSHHRAIPQAYQGKAENALKVAINNYLRSGKVTGLHSLFKKLKDSQDPNLRRRIAISLIGIHHIYKNKDQYGNKDDGYGGLLNSIPGSRHYDSQKGFLFNDQPILSTNKPEKSIEPIVKMMGDMPVIKKYLSSGELPSDIDINGIMQKFVSQNVAIGMSEPAQKPPSSSRFANAASIADRLAQIKKMRGK